MEAELKAFEQKVSQLVELCHRLRSENLRLRQELATAGDESRELKNRIEGARTRLEQLVDQIPDQAS